MTKKELVEAVHGSQGVQDLTKKATTLLVEAVFEAIQESLQKEERFSYPGFGTFKARKRKARKGRNPRTGKPINIKASKTVTFKPAPAFKETL